MTKPSKTTQNKPEPVKLAPGDYSLELATVAHVPFIIDSWAADQMVNGIYQGVDREIYKIEMRARILRLISSCRCAVVKPTPEYAARINTPSGKDDLFGWACYGWDKNTQRPILHYVYVKPAYRKNGLARDLVTRAAGIKGPDSPAWVSFMIPWLRRVARRYGMVFNPFIHDYKQERAR